jgi:hypothetical protein
MKKKIFSVTFNILTASTLASSSLWKEAGQNKVLLFLVALVRRKENGLLENTVCRKPTHVNLCLHAKSEHHLSQKEVVLNTLIQWAKTICDDDSLGTDIIPLNKKKRRCNGYSNHDVMHALLRR